jgi:ArpU family phage transcriptional regulator
MTVAIDAKEVEKIVITELKEYRTLKVQLQNLKEQEDAGINPFPSFRKNHVINQLKVKQIERTLESLDALELRIIELRYLNPKETNDIAIYLDLTLPKKKYYAIKRKAINNIARALGIL